MVHQGLKLLAFAAVLHLAGCATPRVDDGPPPAPREFRAAWVASVANIDWPSKPGLPVATQKEEIVRIVERAHRLGLNALIVQVRPAADALYASALEPWSEYLTGTQGVAPDPYYDPLALWIAEAHRRGIELHAWFNPYRAKHRTGKSALAATHLANTSPELVKSYGEYLWMDPGEPEAARRTLEVIADVVRRYDVDGVHIDDYFYPYPETAPGGGDIEFPDEPAFVGYRLTGGTLAREDWRRDNVNQLVERINATVHREKSWVRFGVSPFGIGKPERRPAGVVGFSQYDKLYADVELWLARGWMDYLAPQLYWAIDSPGQSFGVLLDYWTAANTAGRHMWPGFFTSRIDATEKSWTVDEIANQIATVRSRNVPGQIHFSMAALMENRKGIGDRLAQANATPALVPATPWLDNTPPMPPDMRVRAAPGDAESILLENASPAPERSWLLAIWMRHGAAWTFRVVPATDREFRIAVRSNGAPLEAIVVSAVSRLGIESTRVSVPLLQPR
ncbi:glycoside hydrolase family 10 protein [Usitatibacter palustris]|uniref:Glycosyl hydrolase-like 10 domain-containing protein n=1 Tax=Usitatibacter palustris TaxID=2732487 RepID=A0A6M4HC00_9PROT|nr:family 10 glycosylhydrolase [Usitatibacter palustris]QJR16595.1 hypothetical protein DSM104440_03430 [Usitatibacter palustris]